MIALRRGQWDRAARDLEEGLALARSTAYLYGEARLLPIAAQLHARRGEQQAAEERLAAAGAVVAPPDAWHAATPAEQVLTAPATH